MWLMSPDNAYVRWTWFGWKTDESRLSGIRGIESVFWIWPFVRLKICNWIITTLGSLVIVVSRSASRCCRHIPQWNWFSPAKRVGRNVDLIQSSSWSLLSMTGTDISIHGSWFDVTFRQTEHNVRFWLFPLISVKNWSSSLTDPPSRILCGSTAPMQFRAKRRNSWLSCWPPSENTDGTRFTRKV